MANMKKEESQLIMVGGDTDTNKNTAAVTVVDTKKITAPGNDGDNYTGNHTAAAADRAVDANKTPAADDGDTKSTPTVSDDSDVVTLVKKVLVKHQSRKKESSSASKAMDLPEKIIRFKDMRLLLAIVALLLSFMLLYLKSTTMPSTEERGMRSRQPIPDPIEERIRLYASEYSCDAKLGVPKKSQEKVLGIMKHELKLTDDIIDGMKDSFSYEEGAAREVEKIVMAEDRYIYGRYVIRPRPSGSADIIYGFTVWRIGVSEHKYKEYHGTLTTKTRHADLVPSSEGAGEVSENTKEQQSAIEAMFQKQGINKLKEKCRELMTDLKLEAF